MSCPNTRATQVTQQHLIHNSATRKLCANSSTGARILPLQIRREEPRHTVAQSHGKRAAVHFLERDSFRPAQFVLHDRLHLARELASVTLDVQLEIEPKTARVPVCRA